MRTQRKPAPPAAHPRSIRAAGKPVSIDPGQMVVWSYEELASKTGLPIGTLRRRVKAGVGPRVVLVGRHHRFLPKDVDRWLSDLRDATEPTR